MDVLSIIEYFFEIFFSEFSLGNNELGKLIQNLVKLNIVFILCKIFGIAKSIPELTLAV